jgi:valyl-tRNA synthetase
VFIATLHLQHDGEELTIDARPSDAIALGAAFQTPIFVAEYVLDNALKDDAKSRLDLLRQRLLILEETIEEYEQKLSDPSFLAEAPDDVVSAARQEVHRMQNEYQAIHRVLKKLE